MTTTTECGANAAGCTCRLPAGHTEPHHCTHNGCGGQWTGSYSGGDFVPVVYPGGFIPTGNPKKDLVRGLAALLGASDDEDFQ